MPAFLYYDYIHLNDIDEKPKIYNQLFILNEGPQMTIMTGKTIEIFNNIISFNVCRQEYCSMYAKVFNLLHNYQGLM